MSATPTSREVLAIHGGSPVREKLLPYGHQSIEETDIQAVVDVLRSDWLTTGPKVDEFEEAFAAYVGAKYAVSFSSGTAALHGAAFAAGLTAGDEAITSPMTFAATANCVVYQGARPVFADVTRDTLNIDPEQIASRITRQTRAVLPVERLDRHRRCVPRLGGWISRKTGWRHLPHERVQLPSRQAFDHG
jgi:aspartate/methionine/tyrosine aminotransferase